MLDLAPSFLPVFIRRQIEDSPICQPPPGLMFSLPWLPVSAPPTGLDECFFFNSLAVGLPYSSIFCQFWLFSVFLNLLLSFFWLCKEGQCVYLHLHLGQKSQIYRIFLRVVWASMINKGIDVSMGCLCNLAFCPGWERRQPIVTSLKIITYFIISPMIYLL